jgi:cytochrome c oxidase subunit IV
MAGLTYEESKSISLKTILLLGAITLVEVFIALLGKGYVVSGFELPGWFVGIAMVALSAYKAYAIIYEFMHMKYEVPGLVKSVLLPSILLIWGIIAFLWEGSYWESSRQKVKDRNMQNIETVISIEQE